MCPSQSQLVNNKQISIKIVIYTSLAKVHLKDILSYNNDWHQYSNIVHDTFDLWHKNNKTTQILEAFLLQLYT